MRGLIVALTLFNLCEAQTNTSTTPILQQELDRECRIGNSVSVNSNADRIVIAESGGTLTILDLKTMKQSNPFPPKSFWGENMVFGRNKTDIYATTSTGRVAVWSLSKGTIENNIYGSQIRGYALALNPQNNLLAAGGLGVVTIYDLNSRMISSFKAHGTNHVFRLSFSSDGKLLATGSTPVPDGRVDPYMRIWSTRQTKLLHKIKISATQIEFISGSDVVTALGADGFGAWYASTGKEIWFLNGAFSALGVHRSSGTIALGGEDGRILLLDMSRRKIIREFIAHRGIVRSVQFIGDHGLVSWGMDDKLKVWKLGAPV